MGYAIGVDVGGTFTDVVLRTPTGTLTAAKCLSTHDDPIAGIASGVTRVLAGVDPAQVSRVVHATTLATNAVLERKGARVAFVTTLGFRSVIPLGRYARVEEDRYDLRFTPPPPPVAAADCFEVVERVSARGTVLTPLDPDSVRRVAARITARGITSAAVCLLHSYACPEHERQVAAILRESIPNVVISSEIWPEIREYERATTTIMSAYVGPLMASYLSRLSARLAELGVRAPIHVMESSGGVISAELAARRAVSTIESGPAAGVLAAAGTGAGDVISFDMGGTTAKACVVRDGRPEITREFHVGGKGSFGGRRAGTGVPIKTPAIDLAEIGAGGGSIAWLDAAGALRVGPRSAGSSPGPACYALGGREPTVTDANLVLGYLSSATIPLSPSLAARGPRPPGGPAGRHPGRGRARRPRDRQRLDGLGRPRGDRAAGHRPARLHPGGVRRRGPHARGPGRGALRHLPGARPRPLRRRLGGRPPHRRPVHRTRHLPPGRGGPRRALRRAGPHRRRRPRPPPDDPRPRTHPLGRRPLPRPVPRPDGPVEPRTGGAGVAFFHEIQAGVRHNATVRPSK